VHAGVDHVDVRIDAGDPADPTTYKQEWVTRKPQLDKVLAFPNLPYFLDDAHGVQLSQSDAILKHVARTYNIMGVPGKEHIVDLALDQLTDNEAATFLFAYDKGPDALAAWFQAEGPKIVDQWTALLQAQPFVTGDIVSVADFKLYVFMEKLRIIETELCPSSSCILNETMVSFLTRIEALPAIKEYMASPNYLARPLGSPHAKWK